ncbi:MAG: carboxymuconolactone decarboxylase family protein [Legionellales bacterium]|nr:carboxymuconolactone decarboxylase family protein [Legionellales bacterium]
MSLEQLQNRLPEFAKDIKLNLHSLLGSPNNNLTPVQVAGIALATAHATRHSQLLTDIQAYASLHLDETHQQAAQAASAMMAMTNVYYRAIHLLEDPAYNTMPAQLRMNIIKNHGISRIDFELYSFAVSALNGCGLCLNAHANTLTQAGVSKEAIQTTLRIAAVINATATALS